MGKSNGGFVIGDRQNLGGIYDGVDSTQEANWKNAMNESWNIQRAHFPAFMVPRDPAQISRWMANKGCIQPAPWYRLILVSRLSTVP